MESLYRGEIGKGFFRACLDFANDFRSCRQSISYCYLKIDFVVIVFFARRKNRGRMTFRSMRNHGVQTPVGFIVKLVC